MDDVLYTGRTIRPARSAVRPRPAGARATVGADRPRAPRNAHRAVSSGGRWQTSGYQIIEGQFHEIDGTRRS